MSTRELNKELDRAVVMAPKLAAVLWDAMTAFDGEEESVKSEHRELMRRMRKVLNEYEASHA